MRFLLRGVVKELYVFGASGARGWDVDKMKKMFAALLLLCFAATTRGADLSLEQARDAQDRAALDRLAGQLGATAQKQPNDSTAQYRWALAQSYIAEVAIEVRDKNQAHGAAEAGIKIA
jgi:hypothetical protein